ncbi:MAG: cyclic nucleotide-binding domain-containing protein, partial [Proteobacteria bacterium]|nr:cyclic nucleotide-binding domain-containing protein [Pseudomonadota bacterium]
MVTIVLKRCSETSGYFFITSSNLSPGNRLTELTEPGEYFGEMAAISGEQRAASIISQGRSSVKRFPGDK